MSSKEFFKEIILMKIGHLKCYIVLQHDKYPCTCENLLVNSRFLNSFFNRCLFQQPWIELKNNWKFFFFLVSKRQLEPNHFNKKMLIDDLITYIYTTNQTSLRKKSLSSLFSEQITIIINHIPLLSIYTSYY